MAARRSGSSLDRAFQILDLFVSRHSGLTNAAIARHLDIASSTCCYILSRLEREGFLIRDPETRRYNVGLKVTGLAHRALLSAGVRERAFLGLQKIVVDTGLSAYGGVLEKGFVIIVERMDGTAPLRVTVDIGSALPFHSTALGKAIVAQLPQEQVLKLIRERGLKAHTPKTIPTAARLLDDLSTVRREGYAISTEEQFPGVVAVAAPVFGPDGTVRAAVSATGAAIHHTWNDRQHVADIVKKVAADTSRRFRFQR